ncbi:uncharacterized protein LOC127794923 isoform X2 [Diospyros lotus]|uniref:uncharacterized protein LOC127794923 isoform X2 n=1 Tax=Diospyros lotus TaxID=55363 RepID=UPI00224F995C|nr:uncharacterized protein LOC127794923 isoform X2 [Diospyros lotus]
MLTSNWHHCRCCGRTLCAEHSSNHMALPQFGINSCVRVCSDCFNDASGSKKNDGSASSAGVNIVTDTVSRLDINAVSESNSKPNTEGIPVSGILECKCGMPLCICETPSPSRDAATFQSKSTLTTAAQSNSKPRKVDAIPKNRGSSSNNKQFVTFGLSQVTNSSLEKSLVDYTVDGEGLREAIKNGDTLAVKELLSKGVDANYCDKQGMSLLHLAALFNRTEIVFNLIEYGASMDHRNQQGETPLDCAPATLQYKMRTKMEEKAQSGSDSAKLS